MKKPTRISLNDDQVDSLVNRILETPLSDEDKTLITNIIRLYQYLSLLLQETKITVHRLRKLFGLRATEKRRNLDLSVPDNDACGSSSETPVTDLSGGETSLSLPSKVCDTVGTFLSNTLASLKKIKPLKEKKKGHGRFGRQDYPGATIIEEPHESLKVGDPCPMECSGHLYSLKPASSLHFTGHALATASLYLRERLRCSTCGKIFCAAHSKSISTQKYDEALIANLAISKYYGGMPFYRLAMLQRMAGAPLPHPTQYKLCATLSDDVEPLFEELKRFAAQGVSVSHDDTTVKILDVIAKNKRKAEAGEKGRTGMFTTAILSVVNSIKICVFLSGCKHAGENLADLLKARSLDLPPVLKMSDALSSNFSSDFKAIILKCLAHARRKFYEIYAYFPEHGRIVIDAFAIIYHHDALTKKEQMDPHARLAYHQEHSAPIMTVLKEYAEEQFTEKRVEPNSSLGKSLKYLLKHWEGFTEFLRTPGAMLDNNLTEQALKIPIRARKNSLFYKTERGARVGSVLTSIIHTCAMNGENPSEYLIVLQKNRRAMQKNPKDWFPWTYKETLKRADSSVSREGADPPLLAA